jgi:hypothetical protein
VSELEAFLRAAAPVNAAQWLIDDVPRGALIDVAIALMRMLGIDGFESLAYVEEVRLFAERLAPRAEA